MVGGLPSHGISVKVTRSDYAGAAAVRARIYRHTGYQGGVQGPGHAGCSGGRSPLRTPARHGWRSVWEAATDPTKIQHERSAVMLSLLVKSSTAIRGKASCDVLRHVGVASPRAFNQETKERKREHKLET